MRRQSRAPLVVGAVLAVLVLGGAIGGWAWVNGQIHGGLKHPARTVVIPAGSSISAIGDILRRAGVIDNETVFELYVRVGGHRALEAGTYRIPSGWSMAQVVGMLENPPLPPQVKVTVPEGYTDLQIAQLMQQKQLFPAADYTAAEALPSWNQDFLAGRLAGAGLQGFLFPDTYTFLPGATPQVVISAQLARFGQKVPADLRARAATNGVNFYQALTLASIIEREAKLDVDRSWIAAVYYNRLRKGMPLEVDATVLYAEGRTSGPVSDQDKQFVSPYNTYLNVGVPPAPIANPGLASINAALQPANVPYTYYFTDPSGRAHYSTYFPTHVACQSNYSLCVTAS